MNEALKQHLASRLIEANVEAGALNRHVGITTDINRKNNTCDVLFVGNFNGIREEKGVAVKIVRGDFWFPRKYSLVEIEDSGGILTIVNGIETKESLMKSNNFSNSNIYANSCNSTYGGSNYNF